MSFSILYMSIKNCLLLIMKTFTHTYNNKFDTSGFKQVKIITFHGLTFESRSNFSLFYNKNDHRLVYEVYDEHKNIYEYTEMYFENNKMNKKYLGTYQGESIFSLKTNIVELWN